MKPVCTGDLHFGAGAKYADDRLGEQEQAWADTLDLAIERGGVAIVAGDVWHRPRPTPAEYLAFTRPIRARSQAVEVWACPGNHDWLAANQPTGLDVLGQLSNLHVVTAPEVVDIRGVKVGWLPWTPPTRLIAAEPGLDRDQINALIANTLVAAAGSLVSAGAQMLVAHWSVTGAALPSGEFVQTIMREPIIPMHELGALEVPVVLGHIHRHQVVGSQGGLNPIFYVGSPIPLDFGEDGYEHGVTVFDPLARTGGEAVASSEFVQLETRPFQTVDHRDNPEAAEALAIAGTGAVREFEGVLPGAVLRMRYRATPEQQARIDTAALSRKFMASGASRVFVLPEIVKSVRARAEAVSDDLGPAEALGAWLRATGAVPEHAMALLALTDQLLTTEVTA